LKIKYFLDSLAYLLLLGSTDGIETNYKRVMHAKREIPVSNCTSDIENFLYATGGATDAGSVEEQSSFAQMLDRLDERAEPYQTQRSARRKERSRFHMKLKRGIRGGEWHRVDTEGKFWVGNNQYVIDDQVLQYQPVPTEYGDYYSMDRILYSGGKFYDMNYDEVKVYAIGGIVPYDAFQVHIGAEM